MQQNLCYNCFTKRQDFDIVCPHCGYNNAENREKYPMALKAGSILDGRYIVGRVLGQGGFGITYLALEHSLNIKVAIKEYLPDSMATRMQGTTLVTAYSGEKQEHFNYGSERFLDEARTLAKFIGNKNIAAVKSYFKENNTAYFVMDYVEGISFKNYITNRGGKVDYQDALRILIPVMDALAAVHREGFIHRDVTPDNIYITKDDEIKLLDFGSARYSLGDKSKSLDVVLKAGYAPKEQYLRRGKQGPYTDIYSLAACFYASITGFLPPESLERIEDDNLVDISVRGIKIPDTLEEAIIKGLELRAEDRFKSMEEFKEAIAGAETSVTPVASILSSLPKSEPIANENAVSESVPLMIMPNEPAITKPIESEPIEPEIIASKSVLNTGEKKNPLMLWIKKNKSVVAIMAGIFIVALVFLVVKNMSSEKEIDPDVASVVLAITDSPIGKLSTPTVLPSSPSAEPTQTEGSPVFTVDNNTPEDIPTDMPTDIPTDTPTVIPTSKPTITSTNKPIVTPTNKPTVTPTIKPTITPTSIPTITPTNSTTPQTITIGGKTVDIGVTNLKLKDCNITDISELAKLTNLTILSLDDNSISDISTLSKLTNLTYLSLNDNNISDISTLAKLTNLTYLSLYNNSISDISALAKLTNLTELHLSRNKISDISSLAKLINLTDLYLYTNKISDISALAKLTNLTALDLSSNKISDISVLAKLTNLTYLLLGDNSISDIITLAKLTNLTDLYLTSNKISNISSLTKLTNLTFLALNMNPLTQNQVDELQKSLQKCNIVAMFITGAEPTPSPTSPITSVTNESFTFKTSNFTVTGTYTGEWKNSKPNGKGTMTMNQNNDYWAIGDTLYSNNWVDGLIQGYGEFIGTGNNKGYSYKGNFKDGLKDGQGTMNGPNGEVWLGTWSKGVFLE